MKNSRTGPLLSVVAPCFNEESGLPEFLKRLDGTLRTVTTSYEIILVNDGSSDRTLAVAADLSRKYKQMSVVSLSRNFGHQVAVTAGLDLARGRAVVLIDADLQDPPELIAEMVAQWKKGNDVVYGQRRTRAGETFFKIVTAKFFYRMMRRITRVHIPVDTGDFRLMDRKVVDAMKMLRESHRFIRGLVSWTGFQQVAVPYDRSPRFAGETHYPFRKMLLFSLDAITSFSIVPLRLLTITGLITLLGVALFASFVIIMKFLDPGYFIAGFPTIVLLIVFFGGLEILALGIIGEYVGRVYEEIKRRPLYFIDRIVRNGIARHPYEHS